MSALVLDQNSYERSISIEQLRAMGFRNAYPASSFADAWEILKTQNPSFALLEWSASDDSLDFVRRIRASEDLPNRAVPIFMLTARGAKTDVESARLAGVDGYLRKPIAALALDRRVSTVLAKPQPFVVTASYVGPCRRRRADKNFTGPLRRLDDHGAGRDAVASDVMEQVTRAAVAALDLTVRALEPGDADAARAVYKTVQDLADIAERVGDRIVAFGAREMARYIQAQGATERLDPEVVRTHAAALHQLVHLPAALDAERENVAQSLRRMVDKKLADVA